MIFLFAICFLILSVFLFEQVLFKESGTFSQTDCVRRILASMVLAVFGLLLWGELGLVVGCVAWFMVACWQSDFETGWVPPYVSYTVFVVSTLFAAVLSGASLTRGLSALVGFVMMGFVLGGIALLSGGRVGSGDVRFGLVMSVLAWLFGYMFVLPALLIAFLIQGVLLFVTRSGRVPFVPAIIIGVWGSLFLVGDVAGPFLEWQGFGIE